ncbi:MAG: hypothetical protein IE878_06020, partial [Epsilonproteobacteria bacterium]|nr:hypothetical protein [Campylobacterota bacterium]MBD3839922.1 hypothetical protein [Campylobacterota bacterium]
MKTKYLLFAVFASALVFGLLSYFKDMERHDTVGFSYNDVQKEDKGRYKLNSVGESILELNGLSEAQKMDAWRRSPIQDDMIDMFPNFQKMKDFINHRVVDDGEFKANMLKTIDELESAYIAGEIDSQSVKAKLAHLGS